MVKDVKKAETCLIFLFPQLVSDKIFLPTSEINPHYNCIAWAMRFADRWVDPTVTAGHWWPIQVTGKVTTDLHPDTLVKAFEALSFTICPNGKKEWFYDKVALYYNPATGLWSHAARIINDNEYYSKIGGLWALHHGAGGTLSNPASGINDYGIIYKYMRRPKYKRFYSLWLSLSLFYDKLKNVIRCLF